MAQFGLLTSPQPQPIHLTVFSNTTNVSQRALDKKEISKKHKKYIKDKLRNSLVVKCLGCVQSKLYRWFMAFLLINVAYSIVITFSDHTQCALLDIVMISQQVRSFILFVLIVRGLDQDFIDNILTSLVEALFETEEYKRAMKQYSHRKQSGSVTLHDVQQLKEETSAA
eukprot:762718_1